MVITMNRPKLLFLLLALLLFLGTSGLAGGALLILKPDGSLIGMESGWLNGSPFSNYLVPGLILLFCNGFLPLLTFWGLILKPNWHWANALNIYKNRHWAWAFSLYSGLVLIHWITIQMVLTQYFWLQPFMIFIGLGIIICTLNPVVMTYFGNEDLESKQLP